MPEILAARDGPVLVLTIDNQPKRNAFTHAMTAALDAWFDRADADRSIRCVVLTGAGDKAFSSGHDMAELLADRDHAADEALNAPFCRPAALSKPVLAAVDGAAHAGGFILALSCDMRICAPGADFAAPGARIGLLPIGGQLSRLPALVPLGLAFEMLATGRRVSAAEAERAGLVNCVTEPGAALARALAIANGIAANSAPVVAGIKGGLRTFVAEGSAAAARFEWAQGRRLQDGPDAEEGIRAFLEKRPPRFA